MTDEVQGTDTVEVTSETVVVADTATAAETVVASETTVASEPVIDWDAAPAAEMSAPVGETAEPVAVYPAPRGTWDFTNNQRVILAILIWLNILMFAVGYLAVTGRLQI